MSFSIRIKESAAKELRRVAKPDRARIVAAIDRLAETPHLGTSLKGDLRGLRRIRVGDYRILYEVSGQGARRAGRPYRSPRRRLSADTFMSLDRSLTAAGVATESVRAWAEALEKP